MKTQNDRVIEHLRQHRRITQAEAWTQLGVMRLASRINDLKNQGFAISKQMVSVLNRFGEECRVAEYRLHEKAEKGVAA